MRLLAYVLLLSSPFAGDNLAARFVARNDAPPHDSIALRHLEARNERFKVDGWLDACVRQDAGGLRFRVIREGGSSYIRNKVLRKALEGEQELIARGEPARAQLSADNYEIAVAPEPGAGGESALLLKARRKDGLLINGRAIVSDPEADLIRVEGRLTKTPSWWTRSVDIVRRYGWRGGIRVPIETTSVADVRLAGRSTFRMTSEYATVNGLSVSGPESAARECLVTQN